MIKNKRFIFLANLSLCVWACTAEPMFQAAIGLAAWAACTEGPTRRPTREIVETTSYVETPIQIHFISLSDQEKAIADTILLFKRRGVGNVPARIMDMLYLIFKPSLPRELALPAFVYMIFGCTYFPHTTKHSIYNEATKILRSFTFLKSSRDDQKKEELEDFLKPYMIPFKDCEYGSLRTPTR